MKPSDFLRDIGRPISYYPNLTRLTGGLGETIFLCQFLYWTDKQEDPEGWIYKTQDEIEQETGMTRWEQASARKNLTRIGLLEEVKKGVPARLYYRPNIDKLDEEWERSMANGITKRERRAPTNKFVATPQRGAATDMESAPPQASNRECHTLALGIATDIPIRDYTENTPENTKGTFSTERHSFPPAHLRDAYALLGIHARPDYIRLVGRGPFDDDQASYDLAAARINRTP